MRLPCHCSGTNGSGGATIEATAGGFPVMPLKVLIAYDGAATGAAYMLATVAWED